MNTNGRYFCLLDLLASKAGFRISGALYQKALIFAGE